MFLKVFWKLGEKLQMWVNKLKVALIHQDTDAISKLLDTVPEFDPMHDKEEIIEVLYLLREASILVHSLQDKTVATMKQIKNNLLFIESTQGNSSNKFEVFS